MAIEMTPEEIEAVFREYNDAVIRGVPIEEDLAQRMRDASVGLRGYTRELKQSIDRIKTSSIGLARALKDGESGASIYNSSVEAGADALATFLKPLGPLGRVIGSIVSLGGKLVSQVNLQTDALFKSYQDLSRFGAGVTTGLEGVMRMSQQMGYTVEGLGQFASALERSAPQLALLGGTVAQGSEQFARLVNDVSGQREMWRRLGLDVEQQNEAYGGFIRIMTISGRAQRLTGDQLAASSQEYLYNLVTLGKLTGQTVEELNAQRERFMASQRFASVQRNLEKQAQDAAVRGDTDAAKHFRDMADRNLMVVSSFPEELRTGVMDAMTGFLGTSEESIKLLRSMPETAQLLASQQFEFSQLMGVSDREAAEVLNNFAGTLGAAGAFDETLGSLIGFVKIESAAINMSMPQRIQAARDEIERQKNQTGAVADQANLRENQLRSTQEIQSLIGVLRGPVTKGMQTLATVTGEATTALGNLAGTNQRGAPPGPGSRAVPETSAPAAAATSAVATPSAEAAVAPTQTPPDVATPSAEAAVAPTRPLRRTPPGAAPTDRPAAVTPNTPGAGATNLNVVQLPGTESMGQFAQGGIAAGPTSGYQAMMDGVNAVVPLGGGRSIPVEMPNMSQGSREQMQMMGQQMTKLDELVRETRTNNMLTQRLLKVAQS